MFKTLFNNKNEGSWVALIIALSVIVTGLVALLLFKEQQDSQIPGYWVYTFPKLNAIINSIVTLCLIAGYVMIRKRRFAAHKYFMLSAFCLSILFLISYVTYHSLAPSTSYEGEGLLRSFYFTILVSHILLAIIIVPLALFTLLRAFQNKMEKHRRIARWTLPVWLYVGVTGVLIYLMISPYYPV